MWRLTMKCGKPINSDNMITLLLRIKYYLYCHKRGRNLVLDYNYWLLREYGEPMPLRKRGKPTRLSK